MYLGVVAEKRTTPASCGWMDIACLQGGGSVPSLLGKLFVRSVQCASLLLQATHGMLSF